MNKPMMACGHQANSLMTKGDLVKVPACASCDPPLNHTVVEEPDLSGRQARCAYGDTIRPSTDKNVLAFFEYRGPGSNDALNMCKHCAYAKNAHRFFPYYNPGRCPNCNADALRYLGKVEYMWGCDNCTGAFTDAEVVGRRHPTPKNPAIQPHEFEPHGPYEYDKYYCGCRGWD
jgi:hypothetical protein